MNKNQEDRIIYTRLEGPGKELASILLSCAYREASALFRQETDKEDKEACRNGNSTDTAAEKTGKRSLRQRILKKAKRDKKQTFWSLVLICGLVLAVLISTIQPGHPSHREAEPVQQTGTEAEAASPAKEHRGKDPERTPKGSRRNVLTALSE